MLRTIPFSAARFSRLFLDYVSGSEAVKPFFRFSPSREGYRAAAASMQYDERNRAVTAAAIRRQYEEAGVPLPLSLLEKFSVEGTLTVTTGHQLCLFTGPLYFIFKIVSVIRLAAQVEQETGKKCVPVYWMASEDHDFDEIASINLFGRTITWQKPGEGAVGKLPVDSLQPLLEELKTLMGEKDASQKLLQLFSGAYRPGRTLAQATRELVHRLFEGKVLILDGDDAALKKLFVPFFRKDIFAQEPYRLVSESAKQLVDAGYDVQVNPREINVFYLREGLRARIERTGSQFTAAGTPVAVSQQAMEQELEAHPEHFSPNVTLRPIYQQVLLPNVAYVGGPGELAYWLEYRRMFEQLDVFFPVLQPRHFALLVDKGAADRMAKLDMQPADLFGDIEELVKKYVAANAGDAADLSEEKEKLAAAFATAIAKAEASDPTLKKNAEAELQKALNSLDALQGKMLRAQKQKQENSVNQLRKLHARFFPGGTLQERYENFIPFMLQQETLLPMLESSFTFPVEGVLVLPV